MGQAFDNLRAQKTRTLLTALGIVFGVGSVIGMLAIGAGAREESLRFIEQLGVRNVLIDSRPATSQEELQQRRRSSPGLTERDVRILQANIERSRSLSPRRTLHPGARAAQAVARHAGAVRRAPSYAVIHSLHVAEGRFFDEQRRRRQRAGLRAGRSGQGQPAGLRPGGRQVRQGERHLARSGGRAERAADVRRRRSSGGSMQDLNNIIYIPLNTFQYRFWDQQRHHEGRTGRHGHAAEGRTRTASKWPRW